MRIQQIIPFTHWPSGDERPLAILSFEMPELEARYGLTFASDLDDLDEHRYAVIRLNDGQAALILKHDQNPNPGVGVHVDARADVRTTLAALLQTLDLDQSSLPWAAEPTRPECASAWTVAKLGSPSANKPCRE